MDRKGQITVLLIIALMVVLGLIIVFSARPPAVESTAPLLDEVGTLLAGCLHQSLEDLLLTLSVQGGYVFLPLETVQTPQGIKGFFSKEGRVDAPSLSDIQVQAREFLGQAMQACINDSSPGRGIWLQRISSDVFEVRFTGLSVQVSLSGPVTYSIKGVTYQKSIAPTILPVRYAHLHTLAGQIARANAQMGGVDLSFLSSMDVQAEIAPLSPGMNVVYLTDPQSSIKGFPYVFTAVMQGSPVFGEGAAS